MPLVADLITPVELTGYARASLDAYERAQGSLSRWLVNETVPDITARAVVGRAGMRPAMAQYRSYDAETPLGLSQGGKRMTFELPPLGLKERVSEYEQIRARTPEGSRLLGDKVEQATERIVASMADRIEIERGRAVEYASVQIDENGFVQHTDWERSPQNTTAAATLWSDLENAKPLDDLVLWFEAYQQTTGQFPGTILTSKKVLSTLQRCKQFRDMAATSVNTATIVNADAVRSILASYDLPAITTFDRQIMHRDGTVRKVLSPEKLFLLPAQGRSQLGATTWGQTLESEQAEYAIAAEERPGIVAGVWRTRDPIAIWVHTAAIALPVLENPDLSFVATVLAA